MIDRRVAAKAFHTALEVLGEPSITMIIYDLKIYGIDFDDPDFKLQSFSTAINEIVGEDAATIIFERFMLELDRLSEKATVKDRN